ncbi:MAG: CBS domain-containing protein [Corynebacteriales bacterium]|nr:CBS domain-containing protein [Mycobacteriales bacterium]
MTTVRDVMSTNVQCVKDTATLREAAEQMRDLDVGALPICGRDDKLAGMITDRDIAVRCVAEGLDPSGTQVASFVSGRPFMVDASDPLEDAVALMAAQQIRRVLVLENKKLVGIISQADIARHAEPDATGQMVSAISQSGYDLAR